MLAFRFYPNDKRPGPCLLYTSGPVLEIMLHYAFGGANVGIALLQFSIGGTVGPSVDTVAAAYIQGKVGEASAVAGLGNQIDFSQVLPLYFKFQGHLVTRDSGVVFVKIIIKAVMVS